MSPNGHTLSSETLPDPSKIRETKWPVNRANSDNILMRRVSMTEKSKNGTNLSLGCDSVKEEYTNKKPLFVLPDVLPVKEKILPHRSQFAIRSISLDENQTKVPPKYTSPPSSPPKSPFAPLRHTTLSSPLKPPPLIESPPILNLKPPPPPIARTPEPTQRSSPMISISTNTPLQISPASSPPQSPCHSPPIESPKDKEPVVVEGLQMVQRTEVILRVNVCTTDASSQTEKEELPSTPHLTRKKLQEEIECEKLSQDLVKQLSPSDRLKDILVPDPDHKKPTDYVSGLFRPEVTSRLRPANSPFRSRTCTPNSSPPPLLDPNGESTPNKSSEQQTSITSSLEPSSPLSPTSAYFTTSEPKAKFLTRYSQDMSQYNIKDTKDLVQKKMELVNRLDRKLEVLRSEQLVVSEECRINDELGENVDCHINRLARSHEAAKFRLHVEEVGKITSLLLGLSGRLARAENALLGMSDDHPERRIMESKRDKLRDQLEEAKELKENIDRRSVSVSNILYQYLNSEEYADYDHFINMKAKLIVDAREISDKNKTRRRTTLRTQGDSCNRLKSLVFS